ncbi:MFS transporter [Pseudomonas sp. BN505]|uniref:MFS transporter n=1 Tax=unclassified Pseudomonas TaxID=196821 RepID=UPI00245410CB|nr:MULTISPECIES: MFS transporter [unclassified Pseudomonas]MDH4842265.1 MFS transporter [Pseudomonas sp. BN605]MDH4855120.1 MFS transporter [Pseudomonas sp. BN505]
MNQPISPTSPPRGIDTPAGPAINSRRVIIASSLGNGLEIFDFTVYSFFAATIGKLFFPAASAQASLLLSLVTFAGGFLARPLGALLIGRIADRHGRKAALSLTIALMTAGTAFIAFTPSYASIGIWATILLVLGRLLQGISAGGEVGTATTFLMESGRKNNRCFMVSWQCASQGAAALAGALTGLLLTSTLSPDQIESWGWRLPFILGLLIGPVGWYIRRHLDETHEQGGDALPLGQVLRRRSRPLLLGILAMAGSTVTMYLVVYYMPTYLTRTLGYPPQFSFALVGLACALMAVIPPVAARFADRLPRRKPILYATTAATLAAAWPAFWLLGLNSQLMCMIAIVALVLPLSIAAAPNFALLMEGFDKAERATCLSCVYSVGVTCFGGFSPLIVTWLIGATGNPLTPAFYLIVALLISLFALCLYPEHPGRD